MRHEEVGEYASAKGFKSHFTKIALLLTSVGLGHCVCVPKYREGHTSVQDQQCLSACLEKPLQRGRNCKGRKAESELREAPGYNSKEGSGKGRLYFCQCTNYVGLVTGSLWSWLFHFFHVSGKE